MKRGSILVLALILGACGSAPAATSAPVAASSTSGKFVLSFTIERGTVRPKDAIVGTATLSLRAPGGATITGSGTLFGFEFSEIGGSHRHVQPVSDGVCAPHRLTSTSPLSSEILKTGAVIEGPDAAWYREFLSGPGVLLPTGDWDITVTSTFFDGEACAGQKVDMRTTVRVHVTE
ncbi:MAG: hypothetical protein ABIZ52_06335 [Candidatus Limnocylindrales bacterium]